MELAVLIALYAGARASHPVAKAKSWQRFPDTVIWCEDILETKTRDAKGERHIDNMVAIELTATIQCRCLIATFQIDSLNILM